jgi:hypothetical protein
MSIQPIKFDGIQFLDAQGIYRTIYGCPLKQRQELHRALLTLHERINRSKITTIAHLYDHDSEFAAIADYCLQLNRIDPNWLNIDQLTQFLIPYRNAEGHPQRPLLEQLNFPPVENQEARGATFAESIAALWTHTNNLEEALRAAGFEVGEYPSAAELDAILEAKNRFSDPKRKNEPPVEVQQQIAADIERRMQDGSWFSGATAIASPQQTDEWMAQMMR